MQYYRFLFNAFQANCALLNIRTLTSVVYHETSRPDKTDKVTVMTFYNLSKCRFML